MPEDCGLSKIAKHFGQQEAVALFRDAAAKEEVGDCATAVQLYRRAFRLWPELDSVLEEDGLPTAVRAAAEAAGIDCGALASMSMETEASPRFDVSATEQWLAYLEEHGYCVLAGVADAEAVAQAKSLLWDFLEAIPGTAVRRGDASTWGKAGGWLPSAGNGILGGFGFGQSAFCWQARLLPRVRQAFAAIWETEDLIVSFDGGGVFRPWARKPEWRTEGSWWHMDQNAFVAGQSGRVCVQGLVSFTDATPETGGLCAVPGSHKQHQEVCERAYGRELPGNFVPVQPGDPALESGGRLVCARAGDLLLWDSRCVHCNTPGAVGADPGESGAESPPGAGAESELLRIVAYVCMTPAAWASGVALAQRREAFIGHASTNHLPHKHERVEEAPELLPHPPNQWSAAAEAQRRMIVGMSSPLLADGVRQVKSGVPA
mmetsp:Transcript_41933/g.121316  ORF Transcript_41933/g.121316 Transcript_41933/m.121316 type:complete len:432 (-) Transcript_41933:44-1339(-)